jgi:hypothetical protein
MHEKSDFLNTAGHCLLYPRFYFCAIIMKMDMNVHVKRGNRNYSNFFQGQPEST